MTKTIYSGICGISGLFLNSDENLDTAAAWLVVACCTSFSFDFVLLPIEAVVTW